MNLLTAERRRLAVLAAMSNGPTSVAAVAARTGTPPAPAYRAVNRLRGRGLVTRSFARVELAS